MHSHVTRKGGSPMKNKQLTVALLGFGVVGSGVAQVITENQDRIVDATGRGADIRYILDLRDFPDSPFECLLTEGR